MLKITKVLITPKALAYLKQRNLTKQYKKAKKYILAGNLVNTRFNKRKSLKENKYYFRINKQFRAIGALIDTSTFVVTHIDNHS